MLPFYMSDFLRRVIENGGIMQQKEAGEKAESSGSATRSWRTIVGGFSHEREEN